jgi:hypothetical protein
MTALPEPKGFQRPHEASTRRLSVGTAGRPVLLAWSARRPVGTARQADLRRALAQRLQAGQGGTVSRQARQRIHLLRSGHLGFLDLHCPQGLLAGRRVHGIGALSRGRSRRQREGQAKHAAHHHPLNAATGASSPTRAHALSAMQSTFRSLPRAPPGGCCRFPALAHGRPARRSGRPGLAAPAAEDAAW